MVSAVIFILLFVFILSSVPVFISLVISSGLVMQFFTSLPLSIIPQRIFSGIDKFSLIAVPGFIFAANVMRRGGLSKRIIDLANAMIGHLRGGLGLSTVVACMMFGAVSGSSPATVAAIGSVVLPALYASHYPKNFSVGLVTSTASVALIIPPSIGMIVYGTVTGVSVGDLFVAGIGSGIVFGLFIMIYVIFFAKKHNLPSGQKATTKELLVALKEAIWALGVPIVVIGGIYGGIFTPTEAAAVAAVYSIIIALFVYREMSFKDLIEESIASAIGTAQIMILIGGASVFAWLLLRLQIPQQLTSFITTIGQSKVIVYLTINLILVIAGMFLDPTSITMIFAPLFLPVVTKFGMDPIHFGIIIVVNGAIGMFTPPFGFNLFVASGITKLSINRMVPAVLPFVWVTLAALLVITFVPQISLWLPALLR